jgi:hypothetical protein
MSKHPVSLFSFSCLSIRSPVPLIVCLPYLLPASGTLSPDPPLYPRTYYPPRVPPISDDVCETEPAGPTGC